jgi:hypothetical protein
MTDRYLGQDARNAVVTRLQHATLGFNALITTINTERTHTAPQAAKIDYKWGQHQNPYIVVDLLKGEALYNDPATPMSMQYANMPEVYSILVSGRLKYTDDNLKNWAEDWIEAIIRSLHNYNDSEISWIAYVESDREDMYKDNNFSGVMVGVLFECRIN